MLSTRPYLTMSPSRSQYMFDIYPTKELQAKYTTRDPILSAMAVVLVFAITSLVFVFYDRTVHQRQAKMMMEAAKANALISSMFPENIQKRIFQESLYRAKRRKDKRAQKSDEPIRRHAASMLDSEEFSGDLLEKEEGHDAVAFKTKPIADLFTDSTVLFADIGGFDAWSTVREPSQVFTLLETVYGIFDKVAKTMRVFKVETIGKHSHDAVNPKPKHAAESRVQLIRLLSPLNHCDR
jgi:class 3 adenylate cyclase